MKKCLGCQLFKNLNEFSSDKSRKDSLDKYCKICSRKKVSDWRFRNPTKVKKYNKTYVKNFFLKKFYNISLNDYYVLRKKQSNKCAICKIRQSKLQRLFSVDHDHKTSIVRGLLCAKCNILLGNCNENPEILKSAIDYLRKNK